MQYVNIKCSGLVIFAIISATQAWEIFNANLEFNNLKVAIFQNNTVYTVVLMMYGAFFSPHLTPSGHLVPSPFWGLADAPIVETNFTELVVYLFSTLHFEYPSVLPRFCFMVYLSEPYNLVLGDCVFEPQPCYLFVDGIIFILGYCLTLSSCSWLLFKYFNVLNLIAQGTSLKYSDRHDRRQLSG